MTAELTYAGATIGYPGVDVVRDATLSVAAGEVVGLIGPNGAGKSTMLRAVTGSARVTTGVVELESRSLADIGPRDRARLVGVVPQQVSAAFSFSAREFVLMGRHPHLSRLQQPADVDISLAEEVMARTDTARLAEDGVDTLSGGDLQRLALAQALVQQPRVLLLDEATSHLDLNHRLQVLDLVRELADSGMAVLAVFHDLDLAARYSDRIAVIDSGRLGPVGPPAEVLTGEMLARVFAVRAVVGTDPVTGSVTVTPVLREEAVERASRGRVLVLGGSGAAAPLLRTLYLAGYDVHAGALNRGDIDHAVAEALGLGMIDLPAFAEVDDAAAAHLRAVAGEADAVVVAEIPVGRANLAALRAVAENTVARRLVFVGALGPERDYTGGEASEAARTAVDAGAMIAHDPDEAFARLAALTRAAGIGTSDR